MSEEKMLEDVIGFLMNVAEFDLRKTKRVPIPGGEMTVVSENYQFMYEVIDWIEAKFSEPKLNENQEIVFEWLKEQKEEHVATPFVLFYQLTTRHSLITTIEILDAFDKLTDKEEFELIQEFATWALDQC